MSRRDNRQRPPHAYEYDPLAAAAAAAWHGTAPQFVPNPINHFLPHLLQNPAALAALQQQHHHQLQLQLQQQQYRPPSLPSHAYHHNPTPNLQPRPAAPPAPAPGPAPAPVAPRQPEPEPEAKPKQQPPSRDQQAALGRAQAAAKKARDDLVQAGEAVTGCKVAQAVLAALKVDSWSSLGVQLHDVPLMRDLFLIEGKVNTFIHCYVAARKILSIYDLEVEICKNQSVAQFKELGLGPFLQHPLVAHYFLVPADLSKVPKLSSKEIVNCLQKFMDNTNKKVTVENFLDYLVEQKSVSGKEKLGVRIQNLGLHVSFLREARRNEVNSLKQPTNTISPGFFKKNTNDESSSEKDFSKDTNFHLGKKALDKRFNAITSRIKQLPGINKHIHFDSTDDEIDGDTSSEGDPTDGSENKNVYSVVDNKDIDKRVSSCPYPSKTEEMERLGLRSEMSKQSALENIKAKEGGKKGFSGGKRKPEENSSPSSSCKKPKLQQKVQMQKQEALATCSLSIGKLEKFITTWKEACHEHPVQQVLELVVNYYGKTPKEKRKIRKFFSQYPGIGFLNVAVRSMGHGLLDSIYDVIHVFNENKLSSSLIPNTTTEIMEIEPPIKEIAKCIEGTSNSDKGNNEPEHSVTTDDVVRRIAEYFESSSGLPGALRVGKIISLNTLNDCETWVTAQFSAKQFNALGHGTFLEFLEKHGQHFPHKLRSSLKWGNSGSPLEVSVLWQQIEIILTQVDSNWLEDGDFPEDIFVKLLQRQFPTIDFGIEQNKSGEELVGSIERLRKGIQTNNITFSISLLEKRWSGILPGNHDNVDGMKNNIVQQSFYSGTVCSREAINYLLKAPMLSDLLLWSHWNLLFAPSLGPFINWLMNTGPIHELACIVTTDGRFIRVDPSATADQFLEAITQCSPFQVAVKLLSLLHIYKGSANTPISLLKRYAQRAIDIIMNNNDLFNGNFEGKTVIPEEPHNPSAKQHGCSTNFIGHFHESSQISCARIARSNILSDIDDTVHFIAKFILDCLGHLPPEFRSLAADILLAGLQTVSKNCYSTILNEATEASQRCMLHDIGLSLGVAEWVEDCHGFCLTGEVDAKTEMHSSSSYMSASEGSTHENSILIDNDVHQRNDGSKSYPAVKDQVVARKNKTQNILNPIGSGTKADVVDLHGNKSLTGEMNLEEAALVIETIRREEFGLDPALSYTENSLLKKQHARLGRALHCLSQELYSQDSHLLLELVQNADDNTYPEGVEPTLAFVLQENDILVLNNERGFSAENIRALCDIGNSTKKGSSRGYIGNKGIGFKSVFRVTDAPEIHSNGFHVKFDISEGQIGFVLPTVVPPYCTNSVGRMLSVEDDKDSCSFWNTCILLPFRSKFKEGIGMCSIAAMFSDLHPSLLLFLHRLKCVKFKNVLNDTLLVMRREALSDGIVRISHGNEIMSWLVISKKLQGTIVRHDVCTTEISVAFTLQETEKGEYEPYLKQQPVFAFLPLRNYGLKFILQGDFVLPSSREEVDSDSAWNQWLLSEFPSLFVSAKESFCALPCFQSCPGKAVTAFMSFVPLPGEVHGFFCQLPHLIISKLCLTHCMVLESSSLQWVYPCNTLRGWDEQTRILFSDGLLHEHLGLGYLSKDISISDTLSRVLGIHQYGPNIFVDMISSVCRSDGCIESLGLEWLCAWFITLHSMLLSHSSRNLHLTTSLEDDFLRALGKIPCIPLSDGSFSSVADGPIWLPYDILSSTANCKSSMHNFPALYNNLRIVSSDLLSMSDKNKYLMEEKRTIDLMDILLKIGVRKLSGHDIIKNHILVTLTSGADATMANKMMIEYVSFIMFHLQSSCTRCSLEREEIMSELRRRPILLTNYGYKCPADEPIHFSKEYGNSVDIGRLLHNVEFKWAELDSCYLMNHDLGSLAYEMKKWREFFEELGVTDFVQVVKIEKKISQVNSSQGDSSETFCTVYDWDSPELANILSTFSSIRCRENCIYLLDVLNTLWDNCYSAKTSLTNVTQCGANKIVQSSFLNCIRSFKWIASTMDEDLHYAADLFYDFEDTRSLLGNVAPYAAIPQAFSKSLVNDIGLKTKVSYSDALMILNSWIASPVPFSASMSQMRKFYSFMSEGVSDAMVDIKREFLPCSSVFTPLSHPRSSEVIPGKFLSSKHLYWHDPTGCSEMTEEFFSTKKMIMFPRKMLSAAYPSLCEFFTEVCGVPKVPTTPDYVEILLRLSNAASPSQVSNQVFRVFVRWANDLCSASDKTNDILFLKESFKKLEITILPTLSDKWVSLHPSFGLVCWVDDDELKQHFGGYSDVNFIRFGELSYEDKQMLSGRVAILMKSLGVPALSKVVYREAIFFGTGDNKEKATIICSLLPYMQRYIYKIHRDTYTNFQKNDITKLNDLRVIVVERLFHKYMLKGRESLSKRKFKCHCLLQESNLYATKEADFHSVSFELSRFFFDGSPDLHFANFLHMVKTMADSGTTVEQIESFIVNNQNVPELPEHEVVWSFSSMFVADQGVDTQMAGFQSACDNAPKHQRTPGIVSSWPSNDWKTAPDFGTSCRKNAPMVETKVNDAGSLLDLSKPAEFAHAGDTWVPVELEGDWTIKEDLRAENTLLVECTTATSDDPQMVISVDSSSAPTYLDLETASSIVDAELTDFNDKPTNVSEERNKLSRGAPDASQLKTGRLGEAVVHKYFADRLGSDNVKWVNEASETGLPYDLVITRGEGFTEYIEVKATVSSKKDWFYISSREWQFALEKGDSFTIAHVVLSGSKKANIVTFKNPYKLYQQKSLRLALLIS